MARYKCPKCGMEYDNAGKCTMDGTTLVKIEGGKSAPAPSGHEDHDHSQHHEMMIRDFKRRFFVSVILTIPVLILSPFIQGLFGFSARFNGNAYVLFALSAAIFF